MATFAIAISLYHVSHEGYLGLTDAQWGSVWAISENGLSLSLCFIISVYSCGVLRIISKYVLIPYFIIKLIYHFSCYSGIILLSEEIWGVIWSYILVSLLTVCLIYCLTLTRRNHV